MSKNMSKTKSLSDIIYLLFLKWLNLFCFKSLFYNKSKITTKNELAIYKFFMPHILFKKKKNYFIWSLKNHFNKIISTKAKNCAMTVLVQKKKS